MSSISLAEYRNLTKKPIKKRRAKSHGTQQVQSEGEATLALHLITEKIEFVQEYQFHSERKWKADFHITGTKLLIEVEGGIWSGGRHTRGKGYLGDMEKYNTAAKLGFTVLRYSTEQVKSGLAVKEIKQMV
jgi:very-short-patch-repair endonuclease